MSKSAAVVLSLLLAGCVTAPARQSVSITEPTPICTSPKECEAMWIRAGEAISALSGMRVRLQTDSVIETFAPTKRTSSRMYGRVVKRPMPNGSYEIQARLTCPVASCANIANAGVNAFNAAVSAAGMPFKTK